MIGNMATNKKGFILYADLIHTVNQLPSDKAGELFKHILSYVNDENPETDDIIVKIAFEPIKQQLKRDLEHWENVRSVRSENGKLGGRPKKAKKPNASLAKLTKANKAVIDNVTVNVTDKDKVLTYKEKKAKFISWFNNQKQKHTGVSGKFKVLTSADDNNLKKLFKDYSFSDFEIAIGNLFISKWAIEKNMLTPSHFLRVENFNKYLNQVKTVKKLNTFD